MSFGPQSHLCYRKGTFRRSLVFGLDFQKHLSGLYFFRDLQVPLKIASHEIWISENIQADMKDKVLLIVIAAWRLCPGFFPFYWIARMFPQTSIAPSGPGFYFNHV